jgi:hypothetical protein
MSYKYILIFYTLFFYISLIFVSKKDRLLYIYLIKNTDYYLWHLYKINDNIIFSYKLYYISLALLFFTFFPIISLFIPEWHKLLKLLNLNDDLYSLAISVNKNKLLSKNMQSKLYWYYIFSQNNIKTPEVYYYLKDKILIKINEIEEHNKSKYFIIKPNYGTQGQSIKKITLNEISNMKNECLLQEYVKDCFIKEARHFRITTIFIHENIILFYIEEIKQNNNYKIASNKANGGILTFCKNNNCDFLSNIEQMYIKEISQKLLLLHKNSFHEIPIIGWDICLTCNGPYVFEGNLGSGINENKYNEYIEFMNIIYNY